MNPGPPILIAAIMFVSTAISYPNGPPHIGHLYESVLADFTKRVLSIRNPGVKLQTGTDDHGKKMEEAALTAGVKPAELCERNAALFRGLNDTLGTGYDAFFRTSAEPKHTELVQTILSRLLVNGDIYLGTYIGWYCIREETFYTEHDATTTDFKDPVTGVALERIEEPSYFFRMEPHREAIRAWLTGPDDPVKPSAEHVLKRLDEPLRDLSISRTGFTWGIPFPSPATDTTTNSNASDAAKHVVYVWFDALLNYVTGSQMLFEDTTAPKAVHIIGCDIVWFHAVIYPAILLAAGLQEYLPYRISVHGFITDSTGRKMSKSVGNVVGVEDALSGGVTALRYYLLTSVPLGSNIAFDSGATTTTFQTELVANYGNLCQRAMGLARKAGITVVPTEFDEAGVPVWVDHINLLIQFEKSFDPKSYIRGVLERSAALNRWIHEVNLPKTVTVNSAAALLNAIRQLTVYMTPVAPKQCQYVTVAFAPGATLSGPFKVF